VTFTLPIKGDIDRILSDLMHAARHKLMAEVPRVMAQASQAGALQGDRVIVTLAAIADQIHDAAMKQAAPIMLDFIERLQVPPTEMTAWARPHLDNLGNSLLGVIPANNRAADHKRIVTQYTLVFRQRLSGVLRDIEIGFEKGVGFARAEKMESKEEWITPTRALDLLKFTLGHGAATRAICSRAHDGMIRARADRFVEDLRVVDNAEVPTKFWWARGEAALTQNWKTGDFETWIEERIHLKAYGVRFLEADILRMMPDDERPEAPPAVEPQSSPSKGGRYAAEFWDDLWVEMCRQLYEGDLKPKKQADIEKAMLDWLAARGETPGVTTIRERARKLWQAIKDGN
jgi:hypothetical protein